MPLLALAVTVAAGVFSHIQARRFVRSRLRFVDAAHKRRSPYLAGFVAAAVMLPIVMILPVATLLTAIAVGIGVGTGVAVGSKDVRLARYHMN